MAGDIGTREKVILVRSDARVTDDHVSYALEPTNARVLHRFGPRVLITEVPEGVDEAVKDRVRTRLSEAELSVGPAEALGFAPDLDPVGAMGLEALRLRESPEYADSKAKRRHDGEAWDRDTASAPGASPAAEAETDEPVGYSAGALAYPTSARMVGKIAVGIILVEGPADKLKFTTAERTKVIAEVQNGLGWLAAQRPEAAISWSYDVKIVTLDVPAGADSLDFGQREKLWRDPAMEHLGYSTGMDGVESYVQDLRASLGTQWAYAAFFTKYPLGHFAYASLGGPRLVMQYANDGWGPDNIDRVFAHETGHIFTAPDEYAASNCNCGGQHGYFKTPNKNCALCAPAGGVACIMQSNSWSMCDYTPAHMGWGAFETKLDAALWRNSNGKIYLFSKDYYVRYSLQIQQWPLRLRGDVDAGYPKPIKRHWTGMPAGFNEGIDAALMRESNGKIYFFKGDQYIRFSKVRNGVDSGYPKRIGDHWPGLPDSFKDGIDAAFWRRSNRKIYFFKGDQYVRYSKVKNGVDPGYPKPIAGNWPGLPEPFTRGIDAVLMRKSNGKIYFFRDTEYVRFSSVPNGVDPGYPKPINRNWMPFPEGQVLGSRVDREVAALLEVAGG